MGEVAYFPPNGTFNLMYFPYYGKKAQVRKIYVPVTTYVTVGIDRRSFLDILLKLIVDRIHC